MRAAIIGPGAIGGFMAERLARSGAKVSALARGATLAALQTHGVRVRQGGVERSAPIAASDNAADLGVQDYVIITLKAQALPDLAPRLAPLIGPKTTVVTAMNGLPWWFFLHGASDLAGLRLKAVDPAGAIEAALPLAQVIGCVIHVSAANPEPGVSDVVGADRLTFGAPDGRAVPAAEALAAALQGEGLKCPVVDDIRQHIWLKLWGNMCVHPIAALTGAGTGRIFADPYLFELCVAMMAEMRDLGAKLGLPIAMTPEARMDVARRLGDFRPSTLQDMEAGRPLELDALLGVLIEVAEAAGQPVPMLKAVMGLVRQAGISKGLYPPLTVASKEH